ncbi:MAG: phosphate ABC transporter permease subunit PstC [candidate division WOR-3 bacterium]
MTLRRTVDRGVRWLFMTTAALSAVVLLGILLFLLSYGVRTFLHPRARTATGETTVAAETVESPEETDEHPATISDFFFGRVWNPDAYGKPRYGILPLLVGSLLTTLIALSIAVPAGVASAIFIAERLSGWPQLTAKTITELFAGFPSVVLGFFGLTTLGPFIARLFKASSGLNLLTAGIVLALMSLPTIISVSDDALRVVPHSFREAACALGASRFTTSIRIVLPAARSGILAATMLGFGRAIGETMAVLMVAGNAPVIPKSIFDPVRTITSTIAIELGETSFNTTHFFALFALGFVLFLIALASNVIAESLIKRKKQSFTL